MMQTKHEVIHLLVALRKKPGVELQASAAKARYQDSHKPYLDPESQTLNSNPKVHVLKWQASSLASRPHLPPRPQAPLRLHLPSPAATVPKAHGCYFIRSSEATCTALHRLALGLGVQWIH